MPTDYPASSPTTIDHDVFGKLTWDPGGGWHGRAVTRLFGNRPRLSIHSPIEQPPMKLSHYVRFALTGKRPPAVPTPEPSPPTERQSEVWRTFLGRADELFNAIAEHLFARYGELREALPDDAHGEPLPNIAGPADIWKHVRVREIEVPVQDTPTPLLAFSFDWPWDPEHGEIGVSLRDWRVEG